ncbi:MAG: TetR/AcrR family transcriptional regulator [Bacillota bacterium]|nr:TetR/AcrR family transcriptional regulator [Bacillota bacterium]
MDTQDKKKDILKAASSCFARYGYEKTTLDDIGKLVGLNKASLYYYYKNKESIFSEVIYTEADEFVKSVFNSIENVPGFKGKILTYLDERHKFIRNAMNLNQLSVESANKIAPIFGVMYQKIMDQEIEHLAGILKGAVRKRQIIECDSQRIAKSVFTVAECIRSRVDCQLTSEEAFNEVIREVDFTVSLILDGLIRKGED